MRVTKFRGKRIYNGEWLFGDLMHDNIGGSYIYPIEAENLYKENAVTPDTVGQFTGLLDGNGQEIFEGDIMRIPETEFNIEIIGVVEFDRGSYVVRSFFSGTRSSLAWAVRERQSGERRGVVIGNIYDNPELQKGGVQ